MNYELMCLLFNSSYGAPLQLAALLQMKQATAWLVMPSKLELVVYFTLSKPLAVSQEQSVVILHGFFGEKQTARPGLDDMTMACFICSTAAAAAGGEERHRNF